MLHPNPRWVRVEPVPIRNIAGDRRKREGVKNGQPVPGKSRQGNDGGNGKMRDPASMWHRRESGSGTKVPL